MLYGIFSDIHSNLIALQAVMRSMQEYCVEKKICLGDLVGYGVNPNECIDLVRESSDIVIMGNHDSVAGGLESAQRFNAYARHAIEWTAEHITPENYAYLRKLPYFVEESGYFFTHASPRAPAEWVYVNSLDEAVDAFEFFPGRVCFIGHTHYPLLVTMGGEQRFMVLDETRHTLEEDERLLVNVGSVGQPRDRNPDASWCLLDTDTNTVEIIRVPYDVQAVQEEMISHEFPEFLITRLQDGR
jgi:diadenosine tetraphosphatase ApaH/serine/threonine PP2A family protein phosphatase